jgi:hypothetical protein
MLKEDVIAIIEAIPEKDFGEAFYNLDFFPGNNESVRRTIERTAREKGLIVKRNGGKAFRNTEFKRHHSDTYDPSSITVYDQ